MSVCGCADLAGQVAERDRAGLVAVPRGVLVHSWSPSGNTILFAAQADPSHRRSIWAVNSDGSGLHQLAIPGCGGAFSDPTSIDCGDPGWSPDGTKIVFARAARSGVNIYTVNRDGSSLFQVTRNGRNTIPDWGTHPLAG
jgi:Tol biopolymer transport system component